MARVKNLIILLLILLTVVSGCATSPKNIILCIGDGMGFEQVRAAAMYANGEQGTLCFESFPYQTDMTTHSANAAVTDSAASGTAMATGHKVNNGVLCVQIPGDGSQLQTLLEYFQQENKAVGLVTTKHITDATPAAFAAHQLNRYNYNNIASDYLTQTKPNVLFGAGENGMTPQAAKDAGYIVVSNLAQLQNLDTEQVSMVSGQFGEDIPYETNWDANLPHLPHLSQMTETALAILDNAPEGFFIMVEGGKIDSAGHDNNLAYMVGETVEFASTVQLILDWAKQRGDTLIIVTADHETGGLKVLKNNGKGKLPEVSWSSKDHTATKVPVYSWGKRAELFTGPMDNTDIHRKIIKATKSAPCLLGQN
jgi:alkaline phosphatase